MVEAYTSTTDSDTDVHCTTFCAEVISLYVIASQDNTKHEMLFMTCKVILQQDNEPMLEKEYRICTIRKSNTLRPEHSTLPA